MPRVDSAEFATWLEEESGIAPNEEPFHGGCQSCGVDEGEYPFMRGYCVICLSFMYGQFVKCQQIATWIDRNLWLLERGEVRDKAAMIMRM